mmetsp:Transcript_32355/g.56022  ORF Transcript_32355/g.56022 Transcript_32355/m.56022 type:complete len:193 (+) Transcript_32355:11-589(+)
MIDLYCWVSLLCEICLEESTLSDSVSTVKKSVKQLEKSIDKTKDQLGRLAADLKADCAEIFNCEDSLENLMMRLQLERRRLLSAFVELTTSKLRTITEEVRSETTKMSIDEVRHVALFCKKVLKAIHTQLPAQLPEVDLVAFGHLKAVCIDYLRLIVAAVLKHSNSREKHMRSEEYCSGAKLMKTSDNVLSC